MSARELLAKLEADYVRLTIKGDCLVLNAPEGVLSPARIEEVRPYKPELLVILGNEVPPTQHGACLLARSPLHRRGTHSRLLGLFSKHEISPTLVRSSRLSSSIERSSRA